MIAPELIPVLDLLLLIKLGDRLKRLRKDQGLGVVAMAKRTGVSRTTLQSVESGDPAVSIGTYLTIMSVLGLQGELAFLTEDSLRNSSIGLVPDPHQQRRGNQHVISIGESNHRAQDLQSLRTLI